LLAWPNPACGSGEIGPAGQEAVMDRLNRAAAVGAVSAAGVALERKMLLGIEQRAERTAQRHGQHGVRR